MNNNLTTLRADFSLSQFLDFKKCFQNLLLFGVVVNDQIKILAEVP